MNSTRTPNKESARGAVRFRAADSARTLRAVGLTVVAVLALGACSKSSSSGGSSGGSGSSGSSGGSSSMDAAAWAKSYCSTLGTFANNITNEQNAFNASNPTDPTAIKQAEIDHINKYVSYTNAVLTELQSGGTPDIPDGSGYVSGYTKAFQAFQTALNNALTQANQLDPTADISTFNTNSQNITNSVNSAFSTLQTDWNGVDPQFTNPGDNPLVNALNNDSNCSNFRNGGTAASTTTTSTTAAGQ